MDDLKLCESDYRFMSILWERAPLSSRELVMLCAERLGWKKSTTYTVLKKLCDRGFAKNEDTIVSALIERDLVEKYESERVIDHAFSGSLPGFLAAFLGGKTLSDAEADALKRLIDEHRED